MLSFSGKSLALVLCLTHIQWAVGIHTNFKYWCGKAYNSTLPHFDIYNIGSPDVDRDLARGPDAHQARIAQTITPYLTSDDDLSLTVFLPKKYFDQAEGGNITVSVAALNIEESVGPQFAGQGYKISFGGHSSLNGTRVLSADLAYTSYDEGSAFSHVLDSVPFEFYMLDPPSSGSYVALNTENKALLANGTDAFYSIGYYVSSGHVFNDSASDFEGNAASVMSQYASEGYNMIMYSGSVADNDTLVQMTLDLAGQHGLLFQADVTGIVGNITALNEFVDKWANHSAFMSYYIGNEPDGPQGIGSFEPVQSQNGYDFIKMKDPYHPVTLVSNCEHTAPDYVRYVDFYMTDVYSIGIPKVYNGLYCNSTYGDCGCDNCDGDDPVGSVAQRYDSIYADLGVEYPATTFVEQTFDSPSSYWSRLPTYQEELAMAWISIVAGGNGVIGYTWPVAETPGMNPPLSQAVSDFASQMVSGGLANRTLMTGFRTGYKSANGVYLASWNNDTIVAVNSANKTANVTISTADLGVTGSLASQKTLSTASMNSTFSNYSSPDYSSGYLADTFQSLGIKAYYFR